VDPHHAGRTPPATFYVEKHNSDGAIFNIPLWNLNYLLSINIQHFYAGVPVLR
jgi:hypothetical protein